MSHYKTDEEQWALIRAFFQKHRQWMLYLGAASLIAVSGYRYMHWHTQHTRQEASKLYESLIVAAETNDPVKERAFANRLATVYSQTIYAVFAKLMLARLDVEAGKLVTAEQALQWVVDHARISAMRQIARLRLARLLIAEQQWAAARDVLSTLGDAHYQDRVAALQHMLADRKDHAS